MKEYEFMLRFSLPTASEDPGSYIEKLGEAGCDDAMIGVGTKGRIALDFCRESESAQEAVLSALSDVKSVIPNAELIEAKPDFVGISDMADVLGFSRQYMRKLMLRHHATFPKPIHEGNPSMWHLASVLDWFQRQDRKQIDHALFDVASATMQLNIAKEAAHLDSKLQSRLVAALA